LDVPLCRGTIIYMKNSLNVLKVISLVFVCGFIFSACSASSPTSTPNNSGAVVPADQKSGDTTKTGMISEISGKYYLQQAGGIPEQIESLSVDLSMYVGQTVTVTGQFSGDTLFVGSVE